MQQKDIGRIIGKAGIMISKLTKENNVQMTIGKWLEPTKENRDEYDEIHGVIISGRNDNVKFCQSQVLQLLSSSQEPATKRIKKQ